VYQYWKGCSKNKKKKQELLDFYELLEWLYTHTLKIQNALSKQQHSFIEAATSENGWHQQSSESQRSVWQSI